MPRVTLWPGGKSLPATTGAPLRDILFAEGVEFPCGGKGSCKGCRVRVLEGEWPVSPTDARLLSRQDLDHGWRISCQGDVLGDLTLELAQWQMPILSDESTFHFQPQEGLGIAIDLGTTTIAAQLLDLNSGQILSVATALNAQAIHGADLMTRLEFALNGGGETLSEIIRKQLGDITQDLASRAGGVSNLRKVIIAGNSAMHHLFSRLPVESLACDPFEPFSVDMQLFSSEVLGWKSKDVQVRFLPCLGGFVGSDILAGIAATRLQQSHAPIALLDLGTNGEIVVGNCEKILCASTAAGPAFEGAKIFMGMRAASGAISEVIPAADGFACRVLGGGKPRGICGSGLVDAAAAGLDAGIIEPNGRFSNAAQKWELKAPVSLTQRDIRELQLAKAAISTGLIILAKEWGTNLEQLDKVYLAGAFGNYINISSAVRIGLLPVPQDKVVPAGNTALLGTKLALFEPESAPFAEVRSRVRHLPLNEHPEFQTLFVDQISFPR